MSSDQLQRIMAAAALLTGIAGCGSSGASHSAGGTAPAGAASASATTSAASTSSASSSASPAALSADARSAATGDIPDNQVFLTYSSRAGGYAIRYPEGWTESGRARDQTFRDKNNLVHILITHGPVPTPAAVGAQLRQLAGSQPSIRFNSPQVVRLSSGPAVRARYSTQSAPNQVTGKRVTLLVDRYELGAGGRVAVIDLGTPRGVDNVDAYRMMINSFRWR
jgi:hypothetical protein